MVNLTNNFKFIIDNAEELTNSIKKPCRITFYISEHRSWEQMKLPTFVENNIYKCIGPKPNIEIYHCKYKQKYDLNFLQDIKHQYNIDNFVVACMSPGFEMNWHTDYFEGTRIHIPITTNENCFIETEDIKINCLPNQVYELDTSKKHTAYNFGKTNRLHLIGDVNAV